MSKGKHRRPIPRAERARNVMIDSVAVATTTAMMVAVGLAAVSESGPNRSVATQLPAGAQQILAGHSTHSTSARQFNLHSDAGLPNWAWFDDLRSRIRDAESTHPGGWVFPPGYGYSSPLGHWTTGATKSSAPHTSSTTPSSKSTPKAKTKTSSKTSSTQPAKPPPAKPPVFKKAAVIGDWPSAANTGVPAGVALRSSGGLDITTAGTVINGLDIDGCVSINAANVKIVNSRIRCSTNAGVVTVNSGSVVISHSEIDGLGNAAQCIGFSNFTLDAVNVHNCNDGIKFSSNVVVKNSFVHDLARGAGTHNDALQTMGGSNDVISNNTLLAYDAATDDPMNAALHSGHITHPLSNVLVEHNYMDGGNYTVNAGATTNDGNSISNYVFKDNVFGRDFRYGAVTSLGGGVSFDSSNVYADNGQSVS